MAESVVGDGAETRAAFCCKHLSAAGPPGCTPEQCAMKSDRHAARMALSCSLLGFCDAASVAAAGAGLASRIGSVRFAAGAGAAGAGCDVSAAGAGRTGAGAAASECTACWHAGERLGALPFRESKRFGP